MSGDDDDSKISYVFGLTLELDNGDDTLSIVLSEVPRKHIPYMFSTAIADVITTTLMDMHMVEAVVDDDDEDDE
jgi:hypothetical protein